MGQTLDNEHDLLTAEIMISKKNLLVIALGFIVTFFVFAFAQEISLCPAYSYSACMGIFNGLAEALLPVFPLFLFSLITYKMREEVYQAWFRFVRWWIPLSVLLIFIAPEYSHDWLYPIEKGSVVFLTSAIFLIVSLLIIVAKYISLRRV